MKPNDESHLRKTRSAIKCSYRALRGFRDIRMKNVEQMVGKNYGSGGPENEVPINLIALSIDTYVQSIAASNPHVLLVPDKLENTPTAANLTYDVNRLLEEIEYEIVQRRVVTDALMCMGISKTGVEARDGGPPAIYVDCVDIDNWVHDMAVNDIRKAAFMGDKIRVPYDWVMESDEFQNKDKLKPTRREAWEAGEEKVEDISKDDYRDEDEYQEYVELWEVWLPKERLILTMAAEESAGSKPLKIVEWTGPSNGPDNLLWFSDVPNNTMPLPPVALWRDLHLLANNIFRKLRNQAERCKSNPIYNDTSKDDAERIMNASDGQWVKVNNVDAIKDFVSGGMDRALLASFIMVKDMFSYMAGGLDVIAGLRSVADTARQEMLIDTNANKRVQKMQTASETFTTKVMEKIVHLRMRDPNLYRDFVVRPAGLGPIPSRLTPEKLADVSPSDFRVQVTPYSMQKPSPEGRLRKMFEIFQNFIAPYMQQIQAQGGQVNFTNILDFAARYGNLPELNQIVEFGIKSAAESAANETEAPMPPGPPQMPHGGGGGRTATEGNNLLVQFLLGGGGQESEVGPALGA